MLELDIPFRTCQAILPKNIAKKKAEVVISHVLVLNSRYRVNNVICI
jgi:hypothetical protein